MRLNFLFWPIPGRVLASGGDDSVILLWRLNETQAPINSLFAEEEQDNKETWSVFKSLRYVTDRLLMCYDVS